MSGEKRGSSVGVGIALGIGPDVAIGIGLAYAYDLSRKDNRTMDDKQ